MKPQTAQVLRFLEAHPDGMTSQDAFRALRCTRLAARIADLKADGYTIDSVLETDGESRYARYTLVTEPVQMVVGL